MRELKQQDVHLQNEAGKASKAGADLQVPVFRADGQQMRDAAGNIVMVQARSAKDAEEMGAAGEQMASLVGTIGELKAMRQEYGSEMWNREAVAKSESLAGNARATLKDLYKLGALSGDDYKLLDGQIPGSPLEETSRDGSVIARLDATLSTAHRAYENKLRARSHGGVAPHITTAGLKGGGRAVE